MADSESRILDKLEAVRNDLIRLEGKVDTVKEYYARREDLTDAIRLHERDKHGSGSFKRPVSMSGRDVSSWVKIGALIGGILAAMLAGSQLPL